MARIKFAAAAGVLLLVGGIVLYFQTTPGQLDGVNPDSPLLRSAGSSGAPAPASPPAPSPVAATSPAVAPDEAADPEVARAREVLERMDAQMLKEMQPTVYLAENLEGDNRQGTYLMNGRMMGRRVSATELFSTAFGVSRSRIRTAEGVSLPEGRYDYVVSLKSEQKEALQRLIRERFGLSARPATREEPVMVMTAQEGEFPNRRPSEPAGGPTRSRHEEGGIRLDNAPVRLIVGSLESMLGVPVVDESGLRGQFDIELMVAPKAFGRETRPSSEAIRKAVADQLGLELSRERRELEVILVERAG